MKAIPPPRKRVPATFRETSTVSPDPNRIPHAQEYGYGPQKILSDSQWVRKIDRPVFSGQPAAGEYAGVCHAHVLSHRCGMCRSRAQLTGTDPSWSKFLVRLWTAARDPGVALRRSRTACGAKKGRSVPTAG
ncbi:hypothetical protein GCM10010269_56970 [Streptomyces humidus]|uniref:Uncharacterized protein n=1 Tax=Streptomyces humidus TaxID=52259 RepID=A0A918L5U8_9ACTN|nr:hypothetical protein GCM10010269_56970 [Streptomyces humidus]